MSAPESEGASAGWNLPAERVAAEAQMGRPLEGRSRTASACHLGLPVVLEVHPNKEGRPFPTLYYLTCPLARIRVSRIEAAGGVGEWTSRVESDPQLAAELEAAHEAYARARAEHLDPQDPLSELVNGGVAGGQGVKCLHAHYAHARAGGQNPIGEAVQAEIEPLDCASGCVAGGQRSSEWREPPAREVPVREGSVGEGSRQDRAEVEAPREGPKL